MLPLHNLILITINPLPISRCRRTLGPRYEGPKDASSIYQADMDIPAGVIPFAGMSVIGHHHHP